MSISTLSITMGRIKSAPHYAPMAVFRSDVTNCVEVLFANTVKTMARIEQGEDLVGLYHSGSDLCAAREQIMEACYGS